MGVVSRPNREWLAVIVGAVVGGILGAIVAVNIVIFAGPDEGYEAGIRDVFDHNMIVGLLTVAILFCGPIVGVAVALRRR